MFSDGVGRICRQPPLEIGDLYASAAARDRAARPVPMLITRPAASPYRPARLPSQ
jgi:hypothetical protein